MKEIIDRLYVLLKEIFLIAPLVKRLRTRAHSLFFMALFLKSLSHVTDLKRNGRKCFIKFIYYWKCNFPTTLSVRRSVGRSIIISLKGVFFLFFSLLFTTIICKPIELFNN